MIDKVMIEDAIRGARVKLNHLKKMNKITPIYEDEIKRVRKRLSLYGRMKELK